MKLKIFYRLGASYVSRLGKIEKHFIDVEKCLEGSVKLIIISYVDLEKYLEGLVKLVITSYRLGEMSGGFGETDFLDIPPH